MIEYKLITNPVGWFKEFEEAVNEAIEEGWQPLGGVAVVKTGDQDFSSLAKLPEILLLQAMTRERPRERRGMF